MERKKYLYPAVLVGTVLIGLLLAYSIFQATNRTSQHHFNGGKTYYEEKRFPEATIEFLNALQKDPNHRDARYLLAQSYLAEKNLRGAVKELNTLLQHSPDDRQASLQLANVYLIAGATDSEFFQQAREIAEKLLSKHPEDVLALVLMGNALSGLQDYSSSVERFEVAVRLDPQNATALISLGATQLLQKNYPEAEDAFLKARRFAPKNRTALMSLANYYRSIGEADKAQVVFDEAILTYPADRDVYLQVVTFYHQRGRFEQAERILKAAQEKNLEDAGPSLMLAALYFAKNRPVDARKLLDDVKRRFPENTEVSVGIAQSLLQEQRNDAQSEIEHILKAEPRKPIGHVLLGELQFLNGQYDQAEATLKQDLVLNSSLPAPHFFLGRIAAAKGQTDQAQGYYRKALSLVPAYAPARLALAELFVNKGRTGDARVEVRKVLETQPGFLPGRLLGAMLDAFEQKYPEAEKELSALLKEHPENASVHHRMGVYSQLRGRMADAEKNLIRAVELRPDSLEFLQSLSDFYSIHNQTDRAIHTINTTVPDTKKRAFHYELLGVVYARANAFQEAEAAFRQALQREPDRVSTKELLAVQYTVTGRLDDAQKILSEIVKQNPLNAMALAVKGSILEREGNVGAAKDNYLQSLKIDPTSHLAANNLAYILAEEGRDLKIALRYARAALDKEPRNPNYADTLGWVHHKLGAHAAARDQVQFAASKEPNNPVFQYHLAMIYKETNQISEAERALKAALRNPRNLKERTLATAALREIAR